ncbi:Type II secretion system protein F [Gammaproteobacteria bacterium]
MGAFEYTALDSEGHNRKGVLEGDTARAVRAQLREQKLTPLTVEEVHRHGVRVVGHGRVRRGISAGDLALITRQLATLVGSGLPVEESLGTVAQQTEKSRIKSMILGVRSRVVEGHSLAAALTDFPNAFPELYRATIAAGEQSGHLDAVLDRLADFTESRQAVGQRTWLALLYPALVTVVALLVVGALLVYVVPQVVQVFQGTGQQLPWLTRALIAVSSFLQKWWMILLGGLITAGVALRILLRRPGPRLNFHRLILRLPLFGRLERGMNTSRFARTLSILAASNVPVLDALRIAGAVLSNLVMRAAVEEAARRVREGSALHQAVGTSGYFPPMTVHLIASGEASGRLEEMLERAAVTQEREVDTYVATLLGLFEPLLILIMGGLVLIIVLAILLPIFELNQLVK